MSGTCVRVPVFTGHSLQLQRPVRRVRSAPERAPRAAGRRARASVLPDMPTPLQAAGQDPTLRRPDPADETVRTHGLALFCSNDNLRKGAALNAVQIAELVADQLVVGR